MKVVDGEVTLADVTRIALFHAVDPGWSRYAMVVFDRSGQVRDA